MNKSIVCLAFRAAVSLLSSTSPILASDYGTHEFNMVVSAVTGTAAVMAAGITATAPTVTLAINIAAGVKNWEQTA